MGRYGVCDSVRVGAPCRNLENIAGAPETTYVFLAHTVRSVQIGTRFIREGEVVASRSLVTGVLATYQARFSCEQCSCRISCIVFDSVGEIGVKGEEQAGGEGVAGPDTTTVGLREQVREKAVTAFGSSGEQIV